MLAVLDLSRPAPAKTSSPGSRADAPRPGVRRSGARAVVIAASGRSTTIAPCTRCTATSSGRATPTKEILFTVDRIHDGRSFAARRTQAFQEGVPIFSMIASFQRTRTGLEHFVPMPADIPTRRTCPPSRIAFLRASAHTPLINDRPVELRHVPAPIYLSPTPSAVPHRRCGSACGGRSATTRRSTAPCSPT